MRDSVRKWWEAEVVPHHTQWEQDGMVSRDLWLSVRLAGTPPDTQHALQQCRFTRAICIICAPAELPAAPSAHRCRPADRPAPTASLR